MGWLRRRPAEEDSASPSFEDRLAQIGPGVPGHCPACDGLGYIDNIDIGHRYQIQHCKDCLHRWEYLFDRDGKVVGLTELDADGRPVTRSRVRTSREAPALPTSPAPVEARIGAEAEVEARMAEPVDAGDAEADVDTVVDLRDEVVAPTPVPGEPTELSPAEWLRQAARR